VITNIAAMEDSVSESLSARLAERCAGDGEFRLAARYWSGSVRLDLGDAVVELLLDDGAVSAPSEPGSVARAGLGHIGVRAPVEVWERILAPIPPPYYTDIIAARAFGLRIEGERETFWQYYAAVRRALDLLREERSP
jgi:hypothetical protein